MKLNGLDPISQLAWDSEHCCAVLCHSTGKHILVDLSREGVPLDEDQISDARESGYYFAGVLGLADEEVQVRAEADCLPAMLRAVPDFVKWLKSKFTPKNPDVAELERLFSLPDERKETN